MANLGEIEVDGVSEDFGSIRFKIDGHSSLF